MPHVGLAPHVAVEAQRAKKAEAPRTKVVIAAYLAGSVKGAKGGKGGMGGGGEGGDGGNGASSARAVSAILKARTGTSSAAVSCASEAASRRR